MVERAPGAALLGVEGLTDPRARLPMRTIAIRAAVSALLVALLVDPAVVRADEPMPAPAPGEGFEVERYALSLVPDLGTTAMSGTETIRLRSTAAGLRDIVFSPNALTITDATLDGAPISVASTTAGLAFHLAEALSLGREGVLRFRFAGIPRRGVTTTPTGLYTSYFACDWMVCLQDSPGDKARFALDLWLPAGADAVSIGQEEAARAAPDGRVVHRWRASRPFSPYVFGFAAGRFPRHVQSRGDVTLVTLDATGEHAGLAALFAETPAMIDFLADKAGLGLPAGGYTQVLVPGREAQEAATFSLIGKRHLDEERVAPSSAWVIVHELAHQYWGNLVTCETWQDFWLNEGMATFMTAAWKEHRFGRRAYEDELDIARARVAKARAIGFDKPLAWPGEYPSLGTRRAVQYSKGALFLDHLRGMLGDAARNPFLHPRACGRHRDERRFPSGYGAGERARPLREVRRMGIWRRMNAATSRRGRS